RAIATSTLPDLDPFLQFDEFGSDQATDYIAGFPPHPHRGFETVTYMLDGRMRHRDNKGHSGVLVSGSVQWMTAGRGIVHEEMPEQDRGLMRGFQLWVNLPARDKMAMPRYQEFPPDRMPVLTPAPGVSLKVIAGSVAGTEGPVRGIAVDPLYLDATMAAGATAEIELPSEHTAFAYVYDGTLRVGDTEVGRRTLAILGPGVRIALKADSQGGRAVIVAGRPLNEPIARYGPFVMNTRDELVTAFQDYEAGRL
ncbi:MAG: pirin family protein, partial [Proteobacteria bacterium]|nr:pirin family protein [Pseudomonadota bacterium]